MKSSEKQLLNFFIIILVLKNVLSNSLYITIPSIVEIGIESISYIFFTILIIKYLKVEKRKIILIFIIAMITCYTGYITGNMTLLSSIMFMTIAALVRSRDIIKVSNKIIGATLFIHIFIYMIQVIIGATSVTADFSGRTRYLLGFISPNTSGILALWWVIGKIYLSNYNIKKVCLYTLMLFILYKFNGCRSMLYSIIIVFVLSICINKKIFYRTIKFLSKNIIVIMTVIILISVNFYNRGNEEVKKLDEVLSHRIFFSAQAINENGFTLFGQKVEKNIVKIGNYVGYIVMDVTYIALCYRYGIIYIIFLILLSRYITRKYSEKEYALIIVYAVFATLELYSLNFIICFPMLFGASWIGEKNDT